MGTAWDDDEDFLRKLLAVVAKVRKASPKGNRISWVTVSAEMHKHYPNRKLSREAYRNRYRRLTDNKVNQITKRKDDRVAGRITLEQRLLNEIKRKRPLEWLKVRLDATEQEILAAVSKLQMNGFRGVQIYSEEGITFIHNYVRKTKTIPHLEGPEEGLDIYDKMQGKVIEFAVVSDTHFGNLCADKVSLNKFYDEVERRGLTTVLHAGDLTDGHYTNRPTSVLEQYAVGFSNQLRDFVKDYPRRDGITTYAISGNHDFTYMRNGFANIGEVIDDMRDDIIYLGHNFGRIHLGPKLSVSLIHPTGGISQNYNKRIRDIIEKSPERKSDIMLIGHYHKWAFVKHQGSYGYVVPSFEKRTEFMRDIGIDSVVGGLFFKIKTDSDDNILSVTTEIIEYD